MKFKFNASAAAKKQVSQTIVSPPSAVIEHVITENIIDKHENFLDNNNEQNQLNETGSAEAYKCYEGNLLVDNDSMDIVNKTESCLTSDIFYSSNVQKTVRQYTENTLNDNSVPESLCDLGNSDINNESIENKVVMRTDNGSVNDNQNLQKNINLNTDSSENLIDSNVSSDILECNVGKTSTVSVESENLQSNNNLEKSSIKNSDNNVTDIHGNNKMSKPVKSRFNLFKAVSKQQKPTETTQIKAIDSENLPKEPIELSRPKEVIPQITEEMSVDISTENPEKPPSIESSSEMVSENLEKSPQPDIALGCSMESENAEQLSPEAMALQSPIRSNVYKFKFNFKNALTKENSKSGHPKINESPQLDKSQSDCNVRNCFSQSSTPSNLNIDTDVDQMSTSEVLESQESNMSSLNIDHDKITSKETHPAINVDSNSRNVFHSLSIDNGNEIDTERRSRPSESSIGSTSPSFSMASMVSLSESFNCSSKLSQCFNTSIVTKKKVKNHRLILKHAQPGESVNIDTSNVKLKDILNAAIYHPQQSYRLERKDIKKSNSNGHLISDEASEDGRSKTNGSLEKPREKEFKVDKDGQIVFDDAEDEVDFNDPELVMARKISRDNMEEVVQHAGELQATYRSYSKRNYKVKRWTKEETNNFYKALMAVGTNFTAMTSLLVDRKRPELKKKFKVEEKRNPKFIDEILVNIRPWNIQGLKFDSHVSQKAKDTQIEDSESIEEAPPRKRRRFIPDSSKFDQSACITPDYLNIVKNT